MRVWYLSFLVLLAVPSAAFAKRDHVYVKPAVAAQQMDADFDDCVAQVLALMNGPNSPAPRRQGTPATPFAAEFESIAGAFDMKGPRLAAAAEVRCMTDKGYTNLALTPDEARALDRLHAMPDRDRWYDAFVAGDLGNRIAATPAP